MSVIVKSQEEMRQVAGGLIFHRDRFRDILEESNLYQGIRDRVGGIVVGKGESFEDNFLCWLVFRMWVANKVAYAIQYGREVPLCEDLTDVVPRDMDLGRLASDLRNLDYNIYTNGGQFWMDHEWHQLFRVIAQRIGSDAEARVVLAGGVR